MSQYPTVNVPNNPTRHIRTVVPVPASLAEKSPDAALWALHADGRAIPTQGRWLGGASKEGRALCLDAVVSGGGAMTAQPVPAVVMPESPVQQKTSADGIEIATAGVSVRLSRKADPVLTLAGRETRPVLQYTANGKQFSSSKGDRQIAVVESGPVRTAVEVSGVCLNDAGERGLDYRIRFDLFAGLKTAVVRAWFFQMLPGVEVMHVDQMSLKFPLPKMSQRHVVQSFYGMSGVPRFVTTPDTLRGGAGKEFASWRLVDPTPLADTNVYPACLMPPCDIVSEWFAASDSAGWMTAAVDDLREMLPKGMAWSADELDVEIWPDWAQPMFLPQGRSRSVTVRLAFGDMPAEPLNRKLFESALAVTSPEPVLADWPVESAGPLFDLGELLPQRAEKTARFDNYLKQIACPPTVADMFDLGDTPDPHYKTTYLPSGRRLGYIAPESARTPIQFLAGGYRKAAPWSDLTQFEQIWANNEYDVIWCTASEVLRGRRGDLLRPLRWAARHAIEVDFVHYSDHRWKHRATPAHSSFHTFANAYPSHFWTEGLLGYYLLSGDEDALAFARAIGDKVIEFFNEPMQLEKLWHPTRELGWALVATAALAAVDPDERYQDISRRIADELVKAPLTDEYTANMVKYSFAFASILLGLDRWHRIEPQDRYRDWIVAAARKCAGQMEATTSVVGPMTLSILYLGYKHGGDAGLIRVGMRTLEAFMESSHWTSPPQYVKPCAMFYRPLARFFNAARKENFLQSLDYRY